MLTSKISALRFLTITSKISEMQIIVYVFKSFQELTVSLNSVNVKVLLQEEEQQVYVFA